MKLSNSQVKILIQVYEMVDNARQNKIPVMDISNNHTIKKFEKLLNNIISDRISKNHETLNYLHRKSVLFLPFELTDEEKEYIEKDTITVTELSQKGNKLNER